FATIGEEMADWVELVRLEPAYRVFFRDGSTVDVSTDPAWREQYRHDGRTRVIGELWKAGLAPTWTEDLYFPRGGMYAIPLALADAAEKHGVAFRYAAAVTRVEPAAVCTESERLAADAVVMCSNPGPRRGVIHLGVKQRYSKVVHHNLHLGGGRGESM